MTTTNRAELIDNWLRRRHEQEQAARVAAHLPGIRERRAEERAATVARLCQLTADLAELADNQREQRQITEKRLKPLRKTAEKARAAFDQAMREFRICQNQCREQERKIAAAATKIHRESKPLNETLVRSAPAEIDELVRWLRERSEGITVCVTETRPRHPLAGIGPPVWITNADEVKSRKHRLDSLANQTAKLKREPLDPDELAAHMVAIRKEADEV